LSEELVVRELLGSVSHPSFGDGRLGAGGGTKLTNLLTRDRNESNARGRHRIVMEPYGYHW
jgi:hypothetical protein